MHDLDVLVVAVDVDLDLEYRLAVFCLALRVLDGRPLERCWIAWTTAWGSWSMWNVLSQCGGGAGTKEERHRGSSKLSNGHGASLVEAREVQGRCLQGLSRSISRWASKGARTF